MSVSVKREERLRQPPLNPPERGRKEDKKGSSDKCVGKFFQNTTLPPSLYHNCYNKRRNLLKSYLISKSCCTFASRNRSIKVNSFFYLVALMVWWGQESTPLTPKSNPSLSEMSSKTERLRVQAEKAIPCKSNACGEFLF